MLGASMRPSLSVGLLGMHREAFRLGLGSALALTFAVPALAAGSVTVGTDTSLEPVAVTGCGVDPCSFANIGPVYAIPADGVIVRWRIRTENGTGDWRIRAIGLLDETGLATGRGGGGFETVAPAGTRTFEARVPVQAGDQLGVDGPNSFTAALDLVFADDANSRFWLPPLVDAAPGASPVISLSGFAALYNADIEPDADGDGFGDETQDLCPTDAARQAECDPPQTKITKGAPTKTEKTKVRFRFSSDEPGSTFECKSDKEPYKPCASPRTVKRLDEGKHKFKVRAVDAAGNVDPSPAKDKFKVVD